MSAPQYSKLPIFDAQDAHSKPEKGHTRQIIPWARLSILWPLPLQFLIAVGILALLIYVNGRHFNLTERNPLIQLPGGNATQPDRYTPLQSDVTTFVSAMLVIFRLIAAAWTGSLCWRSAFLLMGRSGLRRQELDWIVSLGVVTPLAYLRDVLISIVGIILLITICAQATSPILTGSITWIPSTRLVELRSDATVSASVVPDLQQWEEYSTYAPRREWTARQAAGLANLAWGRDVEKGVMKRVLPSTYGLSINSTVANVTLPYFSVTALEWIADPMTLPESQRNLGEIISRLSTYGATRSLLLGAGALVPDFPWNKTAPPAISGVSQRRLLVISTHWTFDNQATGCFSNASTIFRDIPSSIGTLQTNAECYAFAWVQYSAGTGICNTCRVSSPSVVENDTALTPQQDYMTLEALRLMPDTSDILVQMNSSIPFSWEGSIDDYVIAVLSRSYSGAWTALTNYLGRHSVPLTSAFSPSVPSLRAQVHLERVYAWFGIQVLSTVCGVIFLGMQFRTKYELIGNTTLTAFELDATEAITPDGRERLREGGLLKLEPKDGGWKVIVEAVTK